MISGKKACYRDVNIIKRTLLTEKKTNQLDKFATYIFEVQISSNKRSVRQAVEKIFNVRVLKVNTLNTRDRRKIAMVKIDANDVILLENKSV